MRMTSILLFSLFMLFTSPKAMAGFSVGNGGGAWVCRESTGSLRWAQLVDFFEARNEFGQIIAFDNQQSVETQIDNILLKVKSYNLNFYNTLYKYLELNKPKFRHVKDVSLTIIDDALYRIAPAASSCTGGTVKYEQLANYTDFDTILVQTEIFEHLTVTEQAGLLVHEAIYKIDRDRFKNRNSVHARKVVGDLFSTQNPKEFENDIHMYTQFTYQDILCELCANFPLGESFSDSMAVYYDQDEGKFGYINKLGQIQIPAQFTKAARFQNGLAAVQLSDNGLWGFIDKAGQVVIPNTYNLQPSDFQNTFAHVSQSINGTIHEGLIDRHGNMVIDLAARAVGNFREGFVWEQISTGCRYLDAQLKTAFVVEHADVCGDFSDGFAKIQIGSVFFFIDNKGNTKKTLQYERVQNYHQGQVLAVKDSKTCDYLNKEGDLLFSISSPRCSSFLLGLAAVFDSSAQKYYLINPQGQRVSESIFDSVGLLNRDSFGDSTYSKTSVDAIPVQMGSYWGFINSKAEVILQPQFKSLDFFFDGYARSDKGYIPVNGLYKGKTSKSWH